MQRQGFLSILLVTIAGLALGLSPRRGTGLKQAQAELAEPSPKGNLTPAGDAGIAQTEETKALSPGLREALDDAVGPCAFEQTLRCKVAPRAMVIGLPDPRSAGMALYLDEALDAVTASFEAAGFRRGRFWFPWAVGNGDSDEQPGWVLFQRAEPPTVVVAFIMGESPVVGVRKASADQALAQSGMLGDTRPMILGPFFSGSAPSLQQALVASKVSLDYLVSGSATGEFTAPDKTPWPRAVAHDRNSLAFMFRELKDRHPNERLRIALLSESSAYGEVAPQATDEILLGRFRFPVHIAQLRVAHASVDDTTTSASPLRSALHICRQQNVREELDALPVASQTSASMTEVALRTTLREIARRDFKYLVIIATDPCDLLYLAQEARVYCPSVRLVTLGAHAMYTHADVRQDLSGMLVVTSYPLFLENQSWEQLEQARYQSANSTTSNDALHSGAEHWGPQTAAFKSFTNESSQGVYNAVQWLLHRRVDTPLAPLDFFAWPAPGTALPGPNIWLTQVYGGRFWPLDVAGGDSCTCGEALHSPHAAHSMKSATNVSDQPSNNALRATDFLRWMAWLWLFLTLAHLLVVIGAQRKPPLRVPLLHIFLQRGDQLSTSGNGYRAAAYFTHASSGFLMGLILFSVRDAERSPGLGIADGAFAGCLFAFAACLALAGGYYLMLTLKVAAHPLTSGAKLNTRYTSLVAYFSSLWILVMVVLSGCNLERLWQALHGDRLRFLLVRLSDPLGMCALWPLFICSAGLYLWSLCNLARVAALERFPEQTPFGDPALDEMALRANGSPAMGSWRHRLAFAEFALLLLLAFNAWYVQDQLLPNFEWPGLDSLLFAGLVSLAAVVLFSCLRGLLLWRALRSLLVRLIATPMADAYDRIGVKVSGSFGLKFASHVPNAEELAVSTRLCGLLASTASRMWQADPVGAEIAGTAGLLEKAFTRLQIAFGSPGTAQYLEDLVDPQRSRHIHELFFEVSRDLSKVLDEVWRQRAANTDLRAFESTLERKELARGETLGDKPTTALLATTGPTDVLLWTRSAEEFVAMRNATFVYHCIDQIRRVLWFAAGGAMVLVIALFSYPLHPPRFVALCGTEVLLLTVGSALWVIVGMERNELLRRLGRATNESPHLNAAFFRQVLLYVLFPLLVLAARLFPDVADAFSGLLHPLLSVMQ